MYCFVFCAGGGAAGGSGDLLRASAPVGKQQRMVRLVLRGSKIRIMFVCFWGQRKTTAHVLRVADPESKSPPPASIAPGSAKGRCLSGSSAGRGSGKSMSASPPGRGPGKSNSASPPGRGPNKSNSQSPGPRKDAATSPSPAGRGRDKSSSRPAESKKKKKGSASSSRNVAKDAKLPAPGKVRP